MMAELEREWFGDNYDPRSLLLIMLECTHLLCQLDLVIFRLSQLDLVIFYLFRLGLVIFDLSRLDLVIFDLLRLDLVFWICSVWIYNACSDWIW